MLSLAAQSSVNALLSSVSGRATDGSRPPVSQTPRVSNPLRPTGAGDVPACDRRERVGRDSPAGQGCRSVREAPEWGFRGPPGTTLLLPFSGAFDAGALAPFTARRSCPGCPAAWSRRRQGTASAGRVASKLTPGYGRGFRRPRFILLPLPFVYPVFSYLCSCEQYHSKPFFTKWFQVQHTQKGMRRAVGV